MKNLKKISKNAREWCNLMNYDLAKVKELMKENPYSFILQRLNKTEAIKEECDLNYPYKFYNPFNFSIMKRFFLTIKGIEIMSYCTKEEAVKRGLDEMKKNSHLCGLDVGIGRIKGKRGKKIYTHMPIRFFLE